MYTDVGNDVAAYLRARGRRTTVSSVRDLFSAAAVTPTFDIDRGEQPLIDFLIGARE
jgi:hypothetical protein